MCMPYICLPDNYSTNLTAIVKVPAGRDRGDVARVGDFPPPRAPGVMSVSCKPARAIATSVGSVRSTMKGSSLTLAGLCFPGLPPRGCSTQAKSRWSEKLRIAHPTRSSNTTFELNTSSSTELGKVLHLAYSTGAASSDDRVKACLHRRSSTRQFSCVSSHTGDAPPPHTYSVCACDIVFMYVART